MHNTIKNLIYIEDLIKSKVNHDKLPKIIAVSKTFSIENIFSQTFQKYVIQTNQSIEAFCLDNSITFFDFSTLNPTISDENLNAGDEVIIPAPYWVSYPEIVRLAQGVPVILSCAEDDNFKLTPDVLAAAITPQSKWLILNSPSNPTGAAYSKDELIALADIVRAHPHLHVLCDDIYEYLIYDGAVFATMAEIAPDLIPRILTLNGVSKSYSMTGWRIGYAAGAAPLIKAMAKIQSQSTSNPNSIAQWAAVAALTGPRDFMAPQLAIFDERRALVTDRLNDIDGISCMKPAGAFYVYPSCAGLIGRATPDGIVLKTDSDVVTYFLEAEGVAMVPGVAFGLSPYFRISYAAATDVLDDAMTRIARACAALR